MAWTDLRGQSLNNINDLLKMKDQRRARRSQNIIGAAKSLGNKAFSAREAEKDREFKAGESELDRENSLDLANINNEGAMARTAFQYESPRQAYEDGAKEYTDPSSGVTYTWDSDQGFQLAQSALRADQAEEAARLEAALRGYGDSEEGGMIREAYEFAKQELLYDPTTGTFSDLADLSDDEVNEMFIDAIMTGGFDGLSEQAIEDAFQLFKFNLDRIRGTEPEEVAEGGEDGDRGVLNDFVTPELVESPTDILTGIFTPQAWPDSIPEEDRLSAENVNDREAVMWNKIMELLPQIADDQQAVDLMIGYTDVLNNPGNTPASTKRNMQDSIDYYFQQAGIGN